MLFVLSITTYMIDSNLVEDNKKPIFIFHTTCLNDGGTQIYYGFGYQIINWNIIGENENIILKGIEKHYLLDIVDPIKGPNIKLNETEEN